MASALDHPNICTIYICTIYEIDSTPEGQLFIVMGFYDGEILRKRIEWGPLEVSEALDITMRPSGKARRGSIRAIFVPGKDMV